MIIEIKPTAEGRFVVYVDGSLIGQPCKTEAKANNVAADFQRSELAKAARKAKADAWKASQMAARKAKDATKRIVVRRRIMNVPAKININLNAPTQRELCSAFKDALDDVDVEIRNRLTQQ